MTQTKYRPILFSTPMVQAILEGRKTQTRRTKGLEKFNENPKKWRYDGLCEDGYFMELTSIYGTPLEHYFEVIPPCTIGDVLWVRETFEYFESNYNMHDTIHSKTSSVKIQFKADGMISNEFSVNKLTALKALVKIEKGKLDKPIFLPSIFMPKEACRIFLKIKSIRVERLQEISEEDSDHEGVKNDDFFSGLYNYLNYGSNVFDLKTAKDSFISLWQKINGKASWDSNPFVFAYEFEQIEKPLDFIS